MSAAEVAEWWGVARRWIYEHAESSVCAAWARVPDRGCASIPRRWPKASAIRRGGEERAMCGDCPGWAAIAKPTRFRRRVELCWVGKQENGRGGALTPPTRRRCRRRNEEAIRKERSRCSSCPVAGRPGGRRWRVGPKVKSKCASGRVAAATRSASTPTASAST